MTWGGSVTPVNNALSWGRQLQAWILALALGGAPTSLRVPCKLQGCETCKTESSRPSLARSSLRVGHRPCAGTTRWELSAPGQDSRHPTREKELRDSAPGRPHSRCPQCKPAWTQPEPGAEHNQTTTGVVTPHRPPPASTPLGSFRDPPPWVLSTHGYKSPSTEVAEH